VRGRAACAANGGAAAEPARRPTSLLLSSVLTFARATGELHSISGVDAGVLALARGLEVAAGREGSLRTEPAPPRAPRGRRARAPAAPPGWGAAGGDWAPMDALDDADAAEDAKAAAKVAAGEGGEPAAEPAAGGGDDAMASSDSGASSGEEEEGEEGWSVAAKSHGAQRRRRRAAARRAARAEARGSSALGDGDDDGWATDGSGEGAASGDAAGTTTTATASDSPVALVTADFAMQNVALQMGLRLVTPDGRRVDTARRWALRCSACAAVTRDPGRVFCPKCGNAALDKVEVIVGADGAETVGVRRQHCLRGTRYSLPKPRGGKGNKDPILREDVLLMRSGRGRGRGKGAAGVSIDPFAPELADGGAWFGAAGRGTRPGRGGVGIAFAMPGWRNNPNESRPHGKRR
jgi:RNA-binding protein NOB1